MDVVQITLESKGGPESIGGLKRLLKLLLRSFGWRCVRIQRVEEPASDDASDAWLLR